jgi:phage protein D
VPAQDFTNQLVIDIGGQRLPADVATLLVEGVVDDSRTSPDLFLLRFRDPGNIVVDKAHAEIGAAVTIAVASNESRAPLPLIVGEVTALEKEADGTGTFTVIRGLDRSHRLLRGRRVASYRDMTVSDVARRVAKNAGLEAGQIDSTTTVHEQVSQGNATDWEFLRGLAADIGAEVTVAGGKLDFRKPTRAGDAPAGQAGAAESPLVLEVGKNVLRLRAVVTSAEQVPSVEVRGWDDAQKRAVVGTAPAATAAAEVGAKPADLAKLFSAPVLVAADTPYRTQGEVDAAAKALSEQVAGGFAELEAVIRGNPNVRAGTAVALANAGKPFDGKYTVTATRHVFEPDTGYTTWVTVSGFHAVRAGRGHHRQRAGRAARGGHRAGVGQPRPRVARPGPADVPVAVRRLRHRLGPHRAARRGRRPRRARRAGGGRRGAGGVRAGQLPAALRHRRALQRRRPPVRGRRPAGRQEQRRREPPGGGVAYRPPAGDGRGGERPAGRPRRHRRRAAHAGARPEADADQDRKSVV